MVDEAMNAMNTANAEQREKFTPAPWYAEERCIEYGNIYRYGCQVIAPRSDKRICCCETSLKDHAEALKANASLIAAAPVMFDALQEIASMEPGESYDEMCDIYEDCSTCYEMIDIARAAIQKARGDA